MTLGHKDTMKLLLLLSILTLAGCVDLAYRKQPPGSLVNKYSDSVGNPAVP